LDWIATQPNMENTAGLYPSWNLMRRTAGKFFHWYEN